MVNRAIMVAEAIVPPRPIQATTVAIGVGSNLTVERQGGVPRLVEKLNLCLYLAAAVA